MELVSAIVPVYNAAATLKPCVSSILNQTYSRLEVILVNDGSKDKSADLCKRFEEQDSRVIVLEKDNSGPADTRNMGLEYASGTYVVFIDADDIIMPTFVQTMVMELEQSGCGMVLCGRYFFRGDTPATIEREIRYPKQILDLHGKEETIFQYSGTTGPMCKLYRKSILDENNIRFPSKLKMCEDGVFNAKYYHECGTVLLSPNQLYYHRLSETSLSKTNHSNLVTATHDLFKTVETLPSAVVRDYFKLGMLKTVVLKVFNAYEGGAPFSVKERQSILEWLFADGAIQSFTGQHRDEICRAISKRSKVLLWKYVYKMKMKSFAAKYRNRLRFKTPKLLSERKKGD